MANQESSLPGADGTASGSVVRSSGDVAGSTSQRPPVAPVAATHRRRLAAGRPGALRQERTVRPTATSREAQPRGQSGRPPADRQRAAPRRRAERGGHASAPSRAPPSRPATTGRRSTSRSPAASWTATSPSSCAGCPRSSPPRVARHLVAAGLLLDEDPQTAYEHTLAARGPRRPDRRGPRGVRRGGVRRRASTPRRCPSCAPPAG